MQSANILERIIKNYFTSRPDPQLLQKRVNDDMAAYEEREERRQRERASESTTPDEDGFVTVVGGHAQNKNTVSDEPEEPFEGLTNFYRFQTRQKRFGQLDELKRKFEEDKARVAQLKKNQLFDKL